MGRVKVGVATPPFELAVIAAVSLGHVNSMYTVTLPPGVTDAVLVTRLAVVQPAVSTGGATVAGIAGKCWVNENAAATVTIKVAATMARRAFPVRNFRKEFSGRRFASG